MTSLDKPVPKVLRGIRSYIGTNAAMLATGAVGATVIAVLVMASSDVYEAVTDANGVSGLDKPMLDLAVSLRTPEGEDWITAFTNLGGTPSMVFITLTLTAVMFVLWR